MLEDKLEKILKEKIIVFGCGRTDKGVHASQYFFHIDVNNEPTFDLEFVLRQHLPSTISLFEIIKVKSQQHTRYHAQERKYDYFIHTKPDPFLERYSVLYQEGVLDIDSMKSSAKLLQEYTDFRSFCIQPDAHNHTLCDINNSNLFGNKDGTRLHFTISGNRFLKGMVRVLVATLLKIGRKEMTLSEFKDKLDNPLNGHNHKPASPNGLYLSSVKYEFLQRPNESFFFNSLQLNSNLVIKR